MATNKQGKMAGYINYRMRVTLNDGRQMTGQMLAFDKHMNLVLADTEEFRRIKRKQNKPAAPGASGSAGQTIETEEKRTLGLTIVRGAQIVSLSVESEPPADPSARLGKSAPGGISSSLAAGPGVARPAGRGAAAPLIVHRVLLPALEVAPLPASRASLAEPLPLVDVVVSLGAIASRTVILTNFQLLLDSPVPSLPASLPAAHSPRDSTPALLDLPAVLLDLTLLPGGKATTYAVTLGHGLGSWGRFVV
ncbi:hypothetical protein B0T11DRAFT_276868 [Plectosphaerella cucumerina]|uniref:Sm protein B n=1 Tax=Plectosphaerella cucumerina TaxID=40658 RepID=A0A8K0TK97_9PEZI|nr:hypothetical protein B0T11DRAFT_276868 [Plectosphaerella cucumerina]